MENANKVAKTLSLIKIYLTFYENSFIKTR